MLYFIIEMRKELLKTCDFLEFFSFLKMSRLREFLSGKPLIRTVFLSYNADIIKHNGSTQDSRKKKKLAVSIFQQQKLDN